MKEKIYDNKISTKIDKVFDKKIFSFKWRFKEYVVNIIPFQSKKLLEEIDLLIDENNLQFIEHNVQEIVSNDTIDIIFNIFEGEKNLIERINITEISSRKCTQRRTTWWGRPLTIKSWKINSWIKERKFLVRLNTMLKMVPKNLKIIDIEAGKTNGWNGAGVGIGTSGGNLAFNIQEIIG